MKNSTFKLRKHCAGLVAAAALTCGASAHADLIDGIVDVWDVTVSGSFLCGSATWSGNVTNTDCAAQNMNWGFGLGVGGQSGLDIFNLPTAEVITDGPAVANTSVTHRNRPIISGSGSLDSVTLSSILTLTPNDPVGAGGIGPDTLNFKINFVETPNAANPCADGSANYVGLNANGCADIFVIDQNSLNFPFYYALDGHAPVEYFISFFEQSSGLNPLPNAACSAAGAAAPCLGFRTPEGRDTTFQFAAVITTEPVTIQVPAPGVLALLGLGLLGLGYTRRKH